MSAATSCENTLYESVDSSPKKVISLFKVKVFLICTMPVQIAKSQKKTLQPKTALSAAM